MDPDRRSVPAGSLHTHYFPEVFETLRHALQGARDSNRRAGASRGTTQTGIGRRHRRSQGQGRRVEIGGTARYFERPSLVDGRRPDASESGAHHGTHVGGIRSEAHTSSRQGALAQTVPSLREASQGYDHAGVQGGSES